MAISPPAAGKIFTMIYLISGVSLLLAFINLVAQRGSSRPLLRRMRGQGLDRSEDDQAKG